MSNAIKVVVLGDVVLPLVRVMLEEDLTWYQREEISRAIDACRRQWVEMGKAQQIVKQQNMQSQGLAGVQLPQGNAPAVRGY